jgi:hypothetical protein
MFHDGGIDLSLCSHINQQSAQPSVSMRGELGVVNRRRFVSQELLIHPAELVNKTLRVPMGDSSQHLHPASRHNIHVKCAKQFAP